MRISIEIPDELPYGRNNSALKGIAEVLLEHVAATGSGIDHTPAGHGIYRAKCRFVAHQIITAIAAVTKR